jgi:uncharacterized protein YdaT
MRGKKYSDEVKEKAYALYAINGNYEETSRALGVPANTIAGWIKNKPPDEFEKLRAENKQRFIDQAGKLIDKGMTLLDRRFTRAIEHENEINALIDVVFDSEISQKEKEKVARKLSELQLQNIRDITTAVGTLYDKRALAQGESTENTKIEFKLPKGVEEYAE